MRIPFLFIFLCLALTQNPSSLYYQCPDSCATCISKTVCTSCISNYFLKDHQCLKCDSTTKLFICSRDFFNYHIEIPKVFSRKLQLVFNRNYDFSNETLQMNNTILNLSPNVSNQSYALKSLHRLSGNILELTIDFQLSFRNKIASVQFKDPFFYFDSENNFLVNTSQQITISEFLNYSEINEDGLQGFVYFIEAFMILIFGLLFFTEFYHLFWFFLDAMQTLNVFYFINTEFPPILAIFLRTLGGLNFSFMGNWFYLLIGKIGNSGTLKDIPLNFMDGNKTASFFYNFGDLLILLILMLVALFFLIGFMRRHAKNTHAQSKVSKFSRDNTESIHANLLLIVGKNLEWKVILKYLEVISFNMLLGTLIALRYCDFTQAFTIVDFVFAIMYALVILIVFRATFTILNNTNVFIGNKEHYRKYGILFDNIDIRRFWARNFSLIIWIQKFCLVLAAVFLYECGYAQIGVMIGSQLFFFLIFLLSRPFYEIQQNILFLTVQGLLLIELFLILGIKIENEMNKNEDIIDDTSVKIQENLGIAGMVFGILVFLVFAGGILALILRKKQEKKNMSMEMNNASGNSSKRTLADKYNMA